VLVFTKCVVYCHDSIPSGVAAIRALGDENGFAVDAIDDAGVFTDDRLKPFQVVVFLSTTVENDVDPPFGPGPNPNRDAFIMTADQKAAFERYIRGGGGYVGVHAASDGDYKWGFYVGLVGAMFKNHPLGPFPTARLRVEDASHPATRDLGKEWTRADEWYNFTASPRGKVHVLVTLDESSFDAQPKMNTNDHPIAWCHEYEGGRSFYTALGHTKESYDEPLMRKHLLGGILWAGRAAGGSCPRP
jgi:type 1 glutamine amidotransferase